MKQSYENEVKNSGLSGNSKRIDIGVMKYLWMANPLSGVRKDSIPRFLRNVELLKNFSDNELRILAKFMHNRKFAENEVIFNEGDIGIGFYFIFSGNVELSQKYESQEYSTEFLKLEEFSYFGEMALLQDGNPRTASAMAKTPCELVGIFKPDLDHMIEHYPVIAAKLVQSISLALAERLYFLTEEASKMSRKIEKLQGQIAQLKSDKEEDK